MVQAARDVTRRPWEEEEVPFRQFKNQQSEFINRQSISECGPGECSVGRGMPIDDC
jgi:hypothetical protein